MSKEIIGGAVAHLREPAMQRAEEECRNQVEHYRLALAASDWDLEVAYPYPDSMRVGGGEFRSMVARRNMAQRLTTPDAGRNSQFCRRPRDPHYRTWSPEAVEQLVTQARELAAQQYEAFIAKLVGKVEADGPVVEAILTGEHVWGRSILTVCHADGSVHKWHTEMIINTSKLGTLFNQWPTRKIKSASRKAA